jgi:hypothetical protein
MRIAIIGTGNMGKGFANLLAGLHHEIFIGHRDPAKAATLAAELSHGIQGGGIAAAVSMADMVLLAVPYAAVADVIRQAGNLDGKILLDLTNPITADFQDLQIGHTTSAAEEIQRLAPSALVVKAFNTIFAQLLPREARPNQPLQVLIAADDDDAKACVSALAETVGFTSINAGGLRNSRFIEPIGEMNIHFGYFLGWGTVAAPNWVKA